MVRETLHPSLPCSIPATTPPATVTGDPGALLYLAWQATNRCKLVAVSFFTLGILASAWR